MLHSHGGKGAARLGGVLALGVTLLALMMTHPSSARPVSGGGPIRHVVVIFQENVSFDHYFATYPDAANTDGNDVHGRAPARRSVNGLNDPLLAPNNPNSVQPFRLSHDQAQTCDQDHGYTDEQKAFDGGLDGQVRRDGRPRRRRHLRGLRQGQGPRDGLLRRQHRHRRSGTTPSTSR